MPTLSILDHLKADLLAARKAHDHLKTETLQSVLAAITNKEAVPVQQETHQNNVGVGSTEVARRVLSEEDILQVVQDEIDEIQAAIKGMGDDGQPYATELKQKIAILTAYLPEPSLKDIEHLMTKLAFPFYQIERDAVPPFEPRRFENDVEHSWSVAFLACSLAPEIDTNLDVGKIAQFAIAHDLIEVFAGDTSPWHNQQTRESKDEREEKALQHIEKQFARFPWVINTIKEYESRASDEAKFVWAVDKVIILLMRYLDKGRYYVENGITKQLFDERLTAHRKKAHAHPKIGEYYEQLLEVFETHPEYFHEPDSSLGHHPSN